ncbi:hypothetical protein [Kitasatospora purpeofusca]|uniref:hypothetical protein n=1 Tax=Kitasatospora purpeofusca TaxID=67352 RepID=UPI0038630617|nr:hypothetical protein OIP63_29090 [Kitasatospora purpeofusca]
MDEDQRAELRYELADRIDRLWDLLGLSEYSRPGFDCTEGTRLAVGADGRLSCPDFDRGLKVAEWVADDASEPLDRLVRDAFRSSAWTAGRTAAALHALDPAWAERWCGEPAWEAGREAPVLPPDKPFVRRTSEPRPLAAVRTADSGASRCERPGDSCERCRPESAGVGRGTARVSSLQDCRPVVPGVGGSGDRNRSWAAPAMGGL